MCGARVRRRLGEVTGLGFPVSICQNCGSRVGGVPGRQPRRLRGGAAPYCGNCGRRASCGGCYRYGPGVASKAATAAMLLPVTAGLFWLVLYGLLG
jgi:MoaA/NifB/PqqE/SkfB family radical SAM enzyme